MRTLPRWSWLALLWLVGCSQSVEARLDTALLEMRQGAYENALTIYAEVLEVVPAAPNVHNNMGYALLQLGRYEDSLAHFETAYAQDPGAKADVALLHNWANALHKLGRDEEAEQKFRAATQGDAGADVYINWGNVLTGLERLKEAGERYRHAVELDPEAAVGWFNLGYTLERLGEAEEALRCYRNFLGMAEGSPSDLGDHARQFVAQAEAAGQASGTGS